MAKKGCIHKIEMEYSTDRLAIRKLSGVYQQLLPDSTLHQEFAFGQTVGEEDHESSGDLRAGILGATKRR